MVLNKDIIVADALDLLNEVGIEGLTIRRLADRLGVQNPALYWHFKHKQELLNTMAERMLLEAFMDFSTAQASDAWDENLKNFVSRFRFAMLNRKDGARVVAGADLSKSILQKMIENEIILLKHSGCDPDVARTGVILLLNYALGASFEQQQDPLQAQDLRQLGFNQSLEVILAGIAAKGFTSA